MLFVAEAGQKHGKVRPLLRQIRTLKRAEAFCPSPNQLIITSIHIKAFSFLKYVTRTVSAFLMPSMT
jgi:hypothetical protein